MNKSSVSIFKEILHAHDIKFVKCVAYSSEGQFVNMTDTKLDHYSNEGYAALKLKVCVSMQG